MIRKLQAWGSGAAEYFGLTRSESNFVLLLILITLAGALVDPAVHFWKSITIHPEEAVAQELPVLIAKDSNRVDSVSNAMWALRRDSLLKLLVTQAPPESVAAFIAATGDPPPRVININTASANELASLPGIGKKMAERIVQFRTENGAFQAKIDLKKVKGIGKKLFEKIEPFVDIQ